MKLTMSNVHLGHYTLGTHYCRKQYKQGGVAIFVSEYLKYQKVDLNKYVQEKDIEICALKVQLEMINFIILCLYRSPTGDFSYFLNQLEVILSKLYRMSSDIIVGGDFNINFLESTPRITLLESIMTSFHLSGSVKFSTRNLIKSHTLIDNIFIDTTKFDHLTTPLINGLSDHDAQIITLHDISGPALK